MVNVDRILELKKRINKIAEELNEMPVSDHGERHILDRAYESLDEADMALGELT